ncbi:MAG TPA: TonB-dependent receptor [Terricaulis sp.]|nr:TonB-dependent receptor [Terricaulis sp.]
MAITGALAVQPAFAQQGDGRVVTAEDIIVTARRREESLREVPASVSAVSAQQMQELGAESLADYIQTVPGASFNAYQAGRSHVVLRGIATTSGNDQGQGAVGYYINDVPLTEPGWALVVPDVDTFDVERVEILRGPQGSLFGSASLGGVVNYIAATAEPGSFDAAFETTLSSTENAGEAGGGAKGMVNIPLGDTLAVRGVYGYRRDAGYLDNIGAGEDGSNDVTVQSGRLSVAWTPSVNTELTYLGLIQNTDAEDGSYRYPALGELTRDSVIAEPSETEFQVHSVRLQQDFGFATLIAVAAATERSEDWLSDFTAASGWVNSVFGANFTTEPLFIESGGESEGQTFEARLASNNDGAVQWLIGAFYYHAERALLERLGAASGAQAQFDAVLGPGQGAIVSPDDQIFNAFYSDIEGEEIALFGEVSWRFAPRWTASVGGRLYRTEVETISSARGFDSYPDPVVTDPGITTEDEGFSPKVTLEFQAAEEVMFYGLVSKGFRFGQPNSPSISAFPIPAGSTSDELINYEIGMRAQPAPNLTLDLTLFHVDWSDIQLRLQTPDFFNYAGNGGEATSSGIEISSVWALTPSFTWRTALIAQSACGLHP